MSVGCPFLYAANQELIQADQDFLHFPFGIGPPVGRPDAVQLPTEALQHQLS